MKKRIIGVLGAVSLMLCLSAVTASAQSIQSDYDRSADLSKLKTFSFAMETLVVNRQSSSSLMNDRRIMEALDKKLAASGYERKDSGRADFQVTYTVTSRNKVDLREYNYGPFRFGNRDISVNQHTEGTLIVDIIDTATRQLIWRGRASGAVDLESVDKKIGKAVDKLVNQFVKDTQKKG